MTTLRSDAPTEPTAPERDPPTDVTRLLRAWSGGDAAALERLYPLVYDELRRLARSRMRRERDDHTLQTTALIHEAYLRMVGQRGGAWESRGHFYAIAAQMMRRVLVDHARKRSGRKRGGDTPRLSLDEVGEVPMSDSRDVLQVHEALKDLGAIDERKARLVELRFFGGLTIDEAAGVMGVSPGTVMRDWTLAKAWLNRRLQPP